MGEKREPCVESQMGGFMSGMIELVGNEIIRSMEFDIGDLKHLRNYLRFAINYVADQLNRETDPSMAEVEREELKLINEYQQTINNFISIWN